jgi:hypothetical protein
MNFSYYIKGGEAEFSNSFELAFHSLINYN